METERGGRLFRPMDPAPLVLFRAVFGAVLGVLVLRYFVHGWIDAQFHEPRLFLSWPGFEWVRPWPRPWMHVHFAALGLLSAGIAAGVCTRTSALLFSAGFTYVHLIDQTNYLNHYYLVSLLTGLLAVLPLGRAGSLDVRWGRVRPAESFPAWVFRLLRFQVGVVYVFAGLAKLQGDWLLRAQPLRLWLSDSPGLLAEPWVAYAMSWAGAAFDLALPALLLWRRTRRWAFAAAVLFHAATAFLFPIGLFPWIMLAGLLVFREAGPAPSKGGPAPPRGRRWIPALVAVYAAVQVAVPLRSWLYPGDVLWTEQGFRFSWRVMVAEKSARAQFHLVDPATGRVRPVRLADYLTPWQAHVMPAQPDLLRRFMELLREEALRRGEGPVNVAAEVDVSLNGRPARPFLRAGPGASASGFADRQEGRGSGP
jgi:vitamin K-dependent gamma-carboxylase